MDGKHLLSITIFLGERLAMEGQAGLASAARSSEPQVFPPPAPDK